MTESLTTTDGSLSLEGLLHEIRKENAQVVQHASRVDRLCNEMERQLARLTNNGDDTSQHAMQQLTTTRPSFDAEDVEATMSEGTCSKSADSVSYFDTGRFKMTPHEVCSEPSPRRAFVPVATNDEASLSDDVKADAPEIVSLATFARAVNLATTPFLTTPSSTDGRGLFSGSSNRCQRRGQQGIIL